MLTKIFSAVISGIEGLVITIEVDVSRGMPSIQIVGLPDTMVREAKERIRGAISNSGIEYPKGRITINLAPASLRKRGSHLDLAIAMGILASSNQVMAWRLDEYAFIGELSLDGSINQVKGLLPMIISLEKSGIKKFIISKKNCSEASLVRNVDIIGVDCLKDIIDFFNRKKELEVLDRKKECVYNVEKDNLIRNVDFNDVRGQEEAKRAIMIAVAGNHGILMTGSPGCGKTMLAERIPTIMPPLSYEEIVETTVIYSIAGLLDDEKPLVINRPFRNPHSTTSAAALIGGGHEPRAGEITLAHKGVLFMDELAEYDRRVIDLLRIPLENKKISLIRKGEKYTYPADFLLVGATNPCKCGYYGDPIHSCKCSSQDVIRYREKLSGPILDRIDLHLNLQPVTYLEYKESSGLSSSKMKEIVESTICIQNNRFHGNRTFRNSEIEDFRIEEICKLEKEEKNFLEDAYDKLKMNPRTVNKTLKVSRTIADMRKSDKVKIEDIAEALRYRPIEFGNKL